MLSSPSPQQEVWWLVQRQLQVLLEQNNLQGAKALLIPVQPVDIAEAIGGLPETMQAIAFRLLSKDEAAEVYEYLDSSVQQSLIEEFKQQEVLDIINRMSPDDRVRLLDELPAKVVRRLLEQLSPREREATAMLMGYTPDTAGRIMTPKYISFKETWTVMEALERIRRLAHKSETVYYLYVTDAYRRLTGILSLRDLVMAQPEERIGDIMERDVVSVHTSTDQEEVAQIIQRYDFLAVPVVDTENRLVGIITVDDVIDILQEEATEDIYALGAVESGGDSYFQSNLLTVARKRVVWLLVLLGANTITTALISTQEDVIQSVVGLASFMPLLIGTGGNVGAQSSTVVIRGLSNNEIRLQGSSKVILREALAGLVLGFLLCIATTLWAFVLKGSWSLAIVVGISLLAISVLASAAGTALPLFFRFLNWDPALMSAPFITTAVDILGVLLYFTIARVLLLSV